RDFGNDQSVLVGVYDKGGLFTKDNIRLIQTLTDEAWKMTDIVRVDSLTNYNYVSVDGDNIQVDPFLSPERELTQDLLNQKKDLAVNHRIMLNRFINSAGTLALIHAQMVPKYDGHESNYRIITQQFQDLLDRHARPGVEYLLLGAAPVNDAFRVVGNHDLDVLTPISLVIIAIILFAVLRTIAGVLLPIVSVAVVVLSSFGLAGLMGVTFNNMTATMPAIMLAICLAEVMHILVVYYRLCDDGMTNYEAMKTALDKNFYATLLTSTTTTFGFVGNVFTELTPISQLGLLATYGTTAAWLLTIFFVAPCIMLIPYKVQDRRFMDVRLFRNPARFVDFIYRHYGKINLAVIALLGVSLYLTMHLEVNSEPYSYFKKSYKIKRDNDLALKEYKGLGGPQLVIQSGVESGINDPQFLKKVDELETWIESLPHVNQVVSLLDVIKDVSQNLHGGKKEFYKIPTERREIAEDILFYSLSLPVGMDLNNLMTMHQDDLRLIISSSLTDSKTSLSEVDRIEKKATELGLTSYVSGKTFLYNRMNEYVVGSFNTSNIWAIILIGTVMMLIFRSLNLGILSLIPNVIPLIYGMGMLKLMGGTLDIGTCMVTSVCFGITVDDTIHFLLNYQSL
ncbi:MAG: MMPL family transporter, partial [Bdellovibrionota bacterium]